MSKAGISLRQVKTFGAVCKLKRDHYSVGDWTIMSDGIRVWISKQKLGEGPTDKIEVPKDVFDRLLAYYEKPQVPPRRQ